MERFWRYGYAATSIDDLVRTTGASRHAIYSEVGGKDALFAQCLVIYSALVVTPAFSRVEASGAGLTDIAAYFEQQIRLAETVGLPGPGCLMANSVTEIELHDSEAGALVADHLTRLRKGFANALWNGPPSLPRTKRLEGKIEGLALTLVVFANGLWSFSRVAADARDLRNSVGVTLHGIENELHNSAR